MRRMFCIYAPGGNTLRVETWKKNTIQVRSRLYVLGEVFTGQAIRVCGPTEMLYHMHVAAAVQVLLTVPRSMQDMSGCSVYTC
mmetsp:Transcript_15299/g.29405  ORF Transcript_15299/g.29405 Transcript_15299/m.29405 type:complete len:83 (-) Transcript_15299:179-427(-)